MTLTPRWRKALLTLHVITSVGWLGIDAALLTLSVSGRTGAGDPGLVYPALGFLGLTLFVPLSAVVWLIGVASAVCTPWGLLRHRWVVLKLLLTTVMLAAVFFALRPNLRLAAELGAATPADVRQDLIMAPSVSTGLLVIATVLSVYKPGSRRARRRADAGGRWPARISSLKQGIYRA